jgi:hypothetical protein
MSREIVDLIKPRRGPGFSVRQEWPVVSYAAVDARRYRGGSGSGWVPPFPNLPPILARPLFSTSGFRPLEPSPRGNQGRIFTPPRGMSTQSDRDRARHAWADRLSCLSPCSAAETAEVRRFHRVCRVRLPDDIDDRRREAQTDRRRRRVLGARAALGRYLEGCSRSLWHVEETHLLWLITYLRHTEGKELALAS